MKNYKVIEKVLDEMYKGWYNLPYSSEESKLLWKHFTELDIEFTQLKIKQGAYNKTLKAQKR